MTSIPSVHPHADEYRKDRTPFLEQATGLGLTEDDLQTIYRIMLLSRTIDDRLFILNRQGKVAFVISGQGHEVCQVGSAYALRSPEHWIVPYYRDLAVVLLRG